MGEIRLFDAPTPSYCSCCFGQDSRIRHVDYSADCDRGFYGPEREQVMDDLILCENCQKTGGRVIGMIDEGEAAAIQRERDEAQEKLKGAELRAERAERYADGLEDAFDKRSTPIAIPANKRPRGPRVLAN